MRLLADENFPKPIVEALQAGGHDILWARRDLSGTSDVALLDLAESEARIVLTLDKDFWQIAIQRPSPLEQSGVVLFRVHPATPENLVPLVRAFGEADTTWA
jgi:predicted nuclease of predicted toxin-antitoxin system